MNAKRRKVDAECRIFKDTWTLDYFFIERSGKPICLICQESLAVNKVANIRRHYETNHCESFKKFTAQSRKDEVERLKSRYEKQTSFFIKRKGKNVANTIASYEVSKRIAEKIKPFTDGNFFKECLLAVLDIVCPEKSLYLKLSAFLRGRSRGALKKCQQMLKIK